MIEFPSTVVGGNLFFPMEETINKVATFMAILSGIVLSYLVVVTFYDVILRYFFSAPLRGRQDIVEMGMVVCLMLATPYTWRIKGHISVDLYDNFKNKYFEIIRIFVIKLLVFIVFFLIAWRSIEASEDSRLFSEATNMILIPHFPFIIIVMIAAILNALIIFLETFLELINYKSTRSDQDLT